MGKSLKGLQGSIVALVTPFAEDGSVDFDALGRLIDFHLEGGTDAILVLGTTGESSTMSHEEDDAVCEFTVKRVAGRVPVIAGSGSNTTQTMLEKSLSYQNLGVDGLLLITPYYNKSNEEGIYQHFKTVLDAVDVPCILYNASAAQAAPSPAQCRAPLPASQRFASRRLQQHFVCNQDCPFPSDDFVMFSATTTSWCPLMSLGAKGVISVWANVMPRGSRMT
ncbi:MAG: dihydrodipicolinate synthase family protein [Eggerthellaceae bacterium]